MKKTLFLALIAVLLVSSAAFGQYSHGWVLIGTKTQTELNVRPNGTSTAWCARPFQFPTQAPAKGFICLTATRINSGSTVTKPQLICKLLGPDGSTVFGDSANSYFSITLPDTVNRPSGSTFNYAIPYDFTRYGNAYGFLLGFKGYVAAETTKMDVQGVRY